MTPRSLDEAHRLRPDLGFSVYAIEQGGPVTLEILDDGQPYAWSAATEREAWERAFPPAAVESLPFDESFVPTEGTAARADLAVSQDDPPEIEPDALGLFD